MTERIRLGKAHHVFVLVDVFNEQSGRWHPYERASLARETAEAEEGSFWSLYLLDGRTLECRLIDPRGEIDTTYVYPITDHTYINYRWDEEFWK